ncbi:MAG: hypothetical protein UV40_C0028G0005 [Parcubacteria group bacterium GW2011_GWA1_42_7]|nr:MAG: hypothetical protein UV40_C0028G0005 [Parcubacteria group bacterium GW2011_GWA1_42_7]
MNNLNSGKNKKSGFGREISFGGRFGVGAYWTDHIKIKMRQYGLSESRIRRILRFPQRIETGIAPDTIAAMQKAGSKKHPYEIWVMWQEKKTSEKFGPGGIIMISAWRYPGTSPIGQPPPIPEDIWESVVKELKLKKHF